MKDRAGEMWEEQHYGVWQRILVVRTDRVSFEERIHTCLNIETGQIKRVKETLLNLWEDTLTENVYESVNRFSRFVYVLSRRRFNP